MQKSLVTLSPQATERMLEMLGGAQCLRLSLKTRGCSGKVYDLQIGQAFAKGDQVALSSDQYLSLDPQATMYFCGLHIDYEDTPLKVGFVFHNPLEQDRCGCGESVSFSSIPH